jgi:FG-GAP-like repeat
MRKFTVVLIANVWICCGSQAHSEEPLLMPGPSSPVRVGHGSGSVLLADINGDGHLDLLTQHLLSSRVAILSGDGKGNFTSFDGAPLRLGYQPGAITLGDVNHDGILDLGVASRDANSEYVHILLGNGSGSFEPVSGSAFTVSSSAKFYKPSLRFVDVNEDKNLDIVAANGRRNTIEILFGDGRGQFSHPSIVKLEPGSFNYSFALADLDGDGHLDVVVASGDRGVEPGRMATMHGDGKGGFKNDHGSRLPVPTGARVGALADLNGGRRPDIVLNHGADLIVLLNQGKGHFALAAGSPLQLGMPAHAVVVADINRDKNADLVVPTVDHVAPYESKVALLLGDGHGFTAAPGSPFPAGAGAYNVAVGDVNEDGKLDVAASSFEGDCVTILLGR